MKKPVFLKFLVCSLVCLSVLNTNVAEARTDDARVLGGIDQSTDIYTYLNTYPFSLWRAYHDFDIYFDLYMSKDRCVVIDLANDKLYLIFILGEGYKTDKGIEVGMTVDDIENAYGPIYPEDMEPRDLSLTYGVYHPNDYARYYKDYAYVEYASAKNEGLSFVIDKNTGKIVLIMYQVDRHGSSNVIQFMKEYNLLPFNQ